MDKLNLLRLFVSVAEKGSFAATANHLGLSPSTVSKAIAKLEGSLKLVLFYRTTRRLMLTDAGQQYLTVARKLLSELEQCEQTLHKNNERPSGVIKLNVPVSYGRLYITPLLETFHRQYPDITLEISYQDAYVDMIAEGIDLLIRSGTLGDSGFIARQLSPIDFLLCASPSYIQRYGIPEDSTEFDQHPWIRFRYRQTGRLHPVLVNDGVADPGQQWIVDDGEALSELCAQGLGLAQMPHFIAKKGLEQGLIKAVHPYHRQRQYGVWIIYPERAFLPAKIKVFIEFLTQQLAEIGETPFTTWAEDLTGAAG